MLYVLNTSFLTMWRAEPCIQPASVFSSNWFLERLNSLQNGNHKCCKFSCCCVGIPASLDISRLLESGTNMFYSERNVFLPHTVKLSNYPLTWTRANKIPLWLFRSFCLDKNILQKLCTYSWFWNTYEYLYSVTFVHFEMNTQYINGYMQW